MFLALRVARRVRCALCVLVRRGAAEQCNVDTVVTVDNNCCDGAVIMCYDCYRYHTVSVTHANARQTRARAYTVREACRV